MCFLRKRAWYLLRVLYPERSPNKKGPGVFSGALWQYRSAQRSVAGRIELGRDARERRGQLLAEAVHNGDDRNRDTGRDETVFNGRRARLVLQKLDEALHDMLLRSTRGCLSWSLLQPLFPRLIEPLAQNTRFPLHRG